MVRQVLGDLAYTAGSVGKFKEALDCISQGKYDEAGKCIQLSYVNTEGTRVLNNRRIEMYQQMLAGPNVWQHYLDTASKQTVKRKA